VYRLCVSRVLGKTLEKGDLSILERKHKDDSEPYWEDEKDWPCIIESLPKLRISLDFRQIEVRSAQVRGRVALNRLILPTWRSLTPSTTSIVQLPLGTPANTECILFWKMGPPDSHVSKITGVPWPRLPFRFRPS